MSSSSTAGIVDAQGVELGAVVVYRPGRQCRVERRGEARAKMIQTLGDGYFEVSARQLGPEAIFTRRSATPSVAGGPSCSTDSTQPSWARRRSIC
jgi:hypothetical protein